MCAWNGRSETESDMCALCVATHQRPTEISSSTIIFVRPRRPSERRLTILV